jgi:hypothetical protein
MHSDGWSIPVRQDDIKSEEQEKNGDRNSGNVKDKVRNIKKDIHSLVCSDMEVTKVQIAKILTLKRIYWHNAYTRESVNKTQMDIKRKTCDIRIWKKNINFSTYPAPTMIHLSHSFTDASKPTPRKSLIVVSATSASGRALWPNIERPWENFSASCEELYATNISHSKVKIFPYDYPLHLVLLPTKKNAQHNAALW